MRFAFYDFETYCGHIKFVRFSEERSVFGDVEDTNIYAMGNDRKELLRIFAPPTRTMKEGLWNLDFGKTDACADGEIANACSTLIFNDPDDVMAELNSIDVEDNFRKQGIGTELVKLTALYISRRGAKFLFGVMSPDDYGGITEEERRSFYYKNLGFTCPTDEEKQHINRDSKHLFISPITNPLLQSPKSVYDGDMTSRVAQILRCK